MNDIAAALEGVAQCCWMEPTRRVLSQRFVWVDLARWVVIHCERGLRNGLGDIRTRSHCAMTYGELQHSLRTREGFEVW